MTARTAVALAAAALVIATAVTEIITGAGVTARIVTIGVLAGIAGAGFVLRLTGTSKGAHAVPRGYDDDDGWVADVRKAVIPRPPTEHEPPWQPAPVWDGEPQTVIEPGAVTHGPPPMAAPVWDDPPEAIIIGVGTMSGGRVTSAHVAVLPPVQCPALPQWVTDILGADSVDGAMTEISRVAHSWESNFTKGDARYLRALTDGAS